ncbi:hypothetical protein JW711_04275 [Candidatus Woesearchaeota archaeon]|nr:hypothetical protein [Candidatus Woesearchaeota archaeon]
MDRYKSEKPFLIGVTGAGGAGKTTLGNNLVLFYGIENCVSVDLDDYLISRDERAILEISGYNPRANKLLKANEDISNLAERKPISKLRYAHATGKVLPEEIVLPKELVVVEGVTTLYPELRGLFDMAFFLDAMEETQIRSRVERDVNVRGYTLEQALMLYENLKPEYNRYIAPTKKFASVVVLVSPDYVMHPISVKSVFK